MRVIALILFSIISNSTLAGIDFIKFRVKYLAQEKSSATVLVRGKRLTIPNNRIENFRSKKTGQMVTATFLPSELGLDQIKKK